MENTNELTIGTDTIDAAFRFINSTASHIFLTGKAGTGKTTFLKNLSSKTHKQLAIVAPTGIAALNAGGVTIHSQFLLPFGSFIPDNSIQGDFQVTENYYTQSTLARKHSLNSARKQVLRSIDLLVIDEVSMLRPDLLDAIDYRLKSARGNFKQRFGGVQLLLIGDLFQLPPVIKRNEQYLLQQYYKSQWFYESIALKDDGFVYIEFDKIFRQKDEAFIRILNNLRNNTITQDDIGILNEHFKSKDEIETLDEVITLTTHNQKADVMNMQALRNLKGLSYYFDAIQEGDFPEHMAPVLSKLELKEGAQIMFVRNDNEEQLYFNGKIATVVKISGDRIEVRLAESNTHLVLRRERWEHKKYSVDPDSKELEEEVIGSFEQYPVKLAWAITIHKSQGLTFDKAIIDVEQAFADGQVYVALSRLRSLEGLVLRTRIHSASISTDPQIVSFTSDNNHPHQLADRIIHEQGAYIKNLVVHTFNFDDLVREINFLTKGNSIIGLNQEMIQPVLHQLLQDILQEKSFGEKYRRQLITLITTKDFDQLLERVEKGSAYYRSILINSIKALLTHIQEMKQHKRVKTYLNNLADLDQIFSKKLEQIDKSTSLISTILNNGNEYDFSLLDEKRNSERSAMIEEIKRKLPDPPVNKKKSGKRKDGRSTSEITLEMFLAGKDIERIAEARGLVPGTIEGHLSKAVGEGKLDISALMSEDELKTIQSAINKMEKEFTSKDIYVLLEGNYSYAKIRAVLNHNKSQ